jgi:hypothetical protein
MVSAIRSIPSLEPTLSLPVSDGVLQDKMQDIFSRASSWLKEFRETDGLYVLRFVDEVAKGVEGLFWGTLFAGGLLSVAFDCSDLVHLNTNPSEGAQNESEHRFKIHRLALKCLSNLSSTFMTGTYFVEWMKDVKWIDCGVLGSIIKPIGYAASMISSCFKILSLVGDYRFVQEEIDKAKTKQATDRYVEHRRLTLLELAFSVNSIAWGALGLASLVFGSPVLSGLTFATLVLGGPLMLAVFFYKKHIADSHNAKADTCCLHLT